MLTIDIEKEPAEVINTSVEYFEYSKEYTLKHKALVNGEETSITTLMWVSIRENYWVVELAHQHGLLETYINGIISQWLLDKEALQYSTDTEALKQIGRVYLFTEEAYTKIIRFLDTMSEKNKENNSHDRQH